MPELNGNRPSIFQPRSCCWLALGKHGEIILVESEIKDGIFSCENELRRMLQPELNAFFRNKNLHHMSRPQVLTAEISGLRCLFTLIANSSVCEEVSWIAVVCMLEFPHESKVSLDVLSKREKQVYSWLLCAKTNGEIGIILGISERTVGKHCESIYRKLGVNSRMDLLVRQDMLPSDFLQSELLPE